MYALAHAPKSDAFVLFSSWSQVALHRSLTNLLRVAEMRPVNWRRYCASPRVPRLNEDASDGALSSPAASAAATATTVATAAASATAAAAATADAAVAGVGEEAGAGSLVAEFGALHPVCLLFALCESGGGVLQTGTTSAVAAGGELQPLLWQLMELTLRPEEDVTTEPKAAAVGAVASVASEATDRSGAGDKKRKGKPAAATAVTLSPHSLAIAGLGGRLGAAAAASAAATGGGSAAELEEEEEEEARGVSACEVVPARSPAQLLIAHGLVGPSTLVDMAQDLLSPVSGAKARKRTARVLHHLWAAIPPGSRPEVMHLLLLVVL